ncbi:hypothetical protein BKP45_04945 [Anaerobacillus alkalidiazotrophicus]|uniref:Uncharacterized protein n=1 Tax=Anaerobacillus alkalidiazotrophicus TaxID=472963 RepID=A0A1S2MDT8_9BACI|nr:hypothetical protein [Anaerobacillus alkalidiazotrophicus]OIJ22027.1 hypothetical protein BKP45_04945 [Anaerobacillus alkalidiazotrophicus]
MAVINKEKSLVDEKEQVFLRDIASRNDAWNSNFLRVFKLGFYEVEIEENREEAIEIYNDYFMNLLNAERAVFLKNNIDEIDFSLLIEDIENDIYKIIKDYDQSQKQRNDDKKKEARLDEIEEIIKLIDNKNYKKASEYTIDNTIQHDIEVVTTLKKFANAKYIYNISNDPNNFLFEKNLVWISPSYNGIKAEEIISYINQFFTIEQWNELHKEERDYQKMVSVQSKRDERERIVEANKPLPKVGMTSNEVLESRWGKPEKVNRTTTANRVREQWAYPNFKYIYLEDGIVTAIKD